jgi:signal-transduction protein with cAMP-binding, CBS, and nucleotidyltransferase domain
MAMLINGVTEVAVTEVGKPIGLIRSEAVMAKLINPRGAI